MMRFPWLLEEHVFRVVQGDSDAQKGRYRQASTQCFGKSAILLSFLEFAEKADGAHDPNGS